MLEWHEWTKDAPPPARERLMWAKMISNRGHESEEWLTGVGSYIPGLCSVRGGIKIPTPCRKHTMCVKKRVYWARFNLPEMT